MPGHSEGWGLGCDVMDSLPRVNIRLQRQTEEREVSEGGRKGGEKENRDIRILFKNVIITLHNSNNQSHSTVTALSATEHALWSGVFLSGHACSSITI